MVLAAGAVLLGAAPGAGHARTRAPGRHGGRQLGTRVRLRLVRRGHRRAHRPAAADRRGEGLGLLGIVSGVPAIVALPTGIWLAGHHLAAAAAAMAATVGLLPLAAIRWLPGGREARRTAPARRMPIRPQLRADGGRRAAAAAHLRRRHRRGRSAGLVPAARQEGCPATSPRPPCSCRRSPPRSAAGRPASTATGTVTPGLLVPALAAAALGMAAMMVLGSPVMIFAGMVLFGAGFGGDRERDVRAADRAAARG